MSIDSRHSLIDQKVQFNICDVYIPEARDLLWSMYSHQVLQGRVVYQTNTTDEEQLVAVEVDGFQERLFIPTKKVEISSG